MGHGKSWRLNDDRFLIKTVKESTEFDVAISIAARGLQRTERACKDRWNSLYKNRRIRLSQRSSAAPFEEQLTIFGQFTETFAQIKTQHQALIEENQHLKERIMELEKYETWYQKFMQLHTEVV